jgi:hypothetical protein
MTGTPPPSVPGGSYPPPSGAQPPPQPPGAYPPPSGTQPPPPSPQSAYPAPPAPSAYPPPATGHPTPPPGSWSTGTGGPPGGGFGTGQSPPGQGNVGLALVGGIAGAFVAGLAWWGIVATTQYQVAFVAIGVGWVVAQAVLICSQQQNRLPLQVIAGTFTLLSLAVSEYFIQRTLFIKEYGDRLGGVEVPLWDGFGYAREVVEESLREDPLTGLFWLAAVVAAVVVTGTRDAVGR